jgi:hypothetical protein
MMSRTTQLTYALLLGGFLLACLSAAILITNAHRLTAAREQLDQTNSQLARANGELIRVRAQAADTQSKMNLARAGTIYLIDSMEASQDFLADQGARVRLLCAQTSGGGRPVPTLSTRSEGDDLNLGSRSDDPDFIRFCGAFSEGADWRRESNAVAMRRATAVSPSDYDAVAAEYQRLLPNAHGSHLETARMHEGLAYSRLRQNRLEDAMAAIGEAQRAAPELALPAMTSLKIDCTRHVDAEQIRAAIQALRVRLDAKIVRIGRILRHGSNPPQERALRYAHIERRMVEQDPELYERCAYAGLTREA